MRMNGFLSQCFGIALLGGVFAGASTGATRQTTSFDPGWRFLKTDAAGGQEAAFDDSSWRAIDVPHDWSIEGPFARANPSGGAGAFLPDGIGWYRKHFTLPDTDAAKHVFIDFDGVMANSDVWINGFHLGTRPYGYVSFEYELSGHLNFGAGKTNVLAVRADEEKEPASRYYTGAGINRHVRLVITDAVHLDYSSVFISVPQVTDISAVVHVQGTVVNQSDMPQKVTVKISLIGPDGLAVAPASDPGPSSVAVEAGKAADFAQDITVASPKLWDISAPHLYQATVSVLDSDKELDDQKIPFGIRGFKFEPATGFSLNGKNIRIQGVCLHEDASAFGTAVPLAAMVNRLTALRTLGVNAIRAAHNPPDPAFLTLCDRMGFLVMDEMFDCWDVAKNKYDYHLLFDQWSLTDLRDTVRRDRNHPCIILYSAGNEIHDTPKGAAAVRILTGLVKAFHENDPTRPVTQALFRPNTSHDYDDGLADLLDVVGTNYRMSELLAAQRAKPTRTLIGTEDHLNDVPILARNPPLSGIFIWAGADYLGESKAWPTVSSIEGIMDRTNIPKNDGYQVAATWSSVPFVQIFRGAAARAGAAAVDGNDASLVNSSASGRVAGPAQDWTPENLEAHQEPVAVFSNCPSVELFLNGVSVGKSNRPGGNGAFSFRVAFAPGTLKAVGSAKAGQPGATQELRTAGAATKIVLAPDKAILAHSWDDVAYVRATITDADGIPVPGAHPEVSFKISGPGALAAVDSADNNSHESFQGTQRQAYNGTCFALIKAGADSGTITVTATAPGLADGSAALNATPPAP